MARITSAILRSQKNLGRDDPFGRAQAFLLGLSSFWAVVALGGECDLYLEGRLCFGTV